MLRRRFLTLGALFLAAVALFLASRKVKWEDIDLIPTGPREIVAHGITYTVPGESCHFNTAEGPLNYRGKSVTVAEREGRLIVNEQDFGAIGPGDEVNLMTKGKVFVNGKER